MTRKKGKPSSDQESTLTRAQRFELEKLKITAKNDRTFMWTNALVRVSPHAEISWNALEARADDERLPRDP